jgi:hypothetical protein
MTSARPRIQAPRANFIRISRFVDLASQNLIASHNSRLAANRLSMAVDGSRFWLAACRNRPNAVQQALVGTIGSLMMLESRAIIPSVWRLAVDRQFNPSTAPLRALRDATACRHHGKHAGWLFESRCRSRYRYPQTFAGCGQSKGTRCSESAP